MNQTQRWPRNRLQNTIVWILEKWTNPWRITNEKKNPWANKCKRFILDRGTLIKLLHHENTQIYVTQRWGGKLITATHKGRGKHSTLLMITKLIFVSPYWWPTIDENIKYHVEYECEERMWNINTKHEKKNQKEKMANTSTKNLQQIGGALILII